MGSLGGGMNVPTGGQWGFSNWHTEQQFRPAYQNEKGVTTQEPWSPPVNLSASISHVLRARGAEQLSPGTIRSTHPTGR
jgi:hypothetical protein